jgi:hypothetical protein
MEPGSAFLEIDASLPYFEGAGIGAQRIVVPVIPSALPDVSRGGAAARAARWHGSARTAPPPLANTDYICGLSPMRIPSAWSWARPGP